MNIIFSSSADRKYRGAVEDIRFFNPQQDQARAGILNSLKRFLVCLDSKKRLMELKSKWMNTKRRRSMLKIRMDRKKGL